MLQRGQRAFISCVLMLFVIILMIPASAIAIDPLEAYKEFLPDEMPIVKRHLRAAWIASIANIDWPSAASRYTTDDNKRIEMQKQELIDKLDKAAELNINAIFLQVRPEADALYKSQLVPWSRYLTGTFGKYPGYDPLAFAIEEAHKRNIELHAWLNPYRVSMNTTESTIASLNISGSVYKEHPDWIKTASDKFVLDPGIPAARLWIEDCVMEIVKNYDIDGIHFDDYFYNESQDSKLQDDSTYAKYNNGQFSNKADWRRNNTYLLVKELSKKIRAAKSWVKFGISPAGIWADKSAAHPDGSNTRAGYTNYDSNFADTKLWVTEELIDYIAPQVYWSFGNTYAPYGEVATWWSNVVKGKNVHLYIGQPLYKVNDSIYADFTNGNGEAEIARQVIFNAAKPEIAGSALFRFNHLYDAAKTDIVDRLENELWARKTLVPVMPWKGGSAPTVPQTGLASKVTGGTKLTWNDIDSKTTYFVIYKYRRGEIINLNSDISAKKIIATVRKNSDGMQEFVDTSLGISSYTYVITSLDRLHNESRGLQVKFPTPVISSKYFYDVGTNVPWAVDAIDILYEQGIVIGDGEGYFRPQESVKRADFMLMLVRAFSLKAEFTSLGNFSDVTTDKYYYEAVGIAKKLGIALGDGTGRFDPEAAITREDVSVLVCRVLELLGKPLPAVPLDRLSEFKDASLISPYAVDSVARLMEKWQQYEVTGSFGPKVLASRAHTAAIIYSVGNED